MRTVAFALLNSQGVKHQVKYLAISNNNRKINENKDAYSG